jgi:ketosteroid isomerase-like protein
MVRPDLVEIFDRYASGDESAIEEFRPLLDRLDPAVVWDSTELGFPDVADVVHGPAAVIDFFRRVLSAWRDFGWETSNFEVHGDDVVYDVHITARSRETNLPLDQHLTHRMTIRNGKLVAWRAFLDRRDAMATETSGRHSR